MALLKRPITVGVVVAVSLLAGLALLENSGTATLDADPAASSQVADRIQEARNRVAARTGGGSSTPAQVGPASGTPGEHIPAGICAILSNRMSQLVSQLQFLSNLGGPFAGFFQGFIEAAIDRINNLLSSLHCPPISLG